MKKIILTIVTAIIALAAPAVSVNSTPGKLASLISDRRITQLTVTGTVNAIDLFFIAEQLPALTSLNLTNATIVELKSDKPVVGTTSCFAANELPAYSFFATKIKTITLPSSLTSIATSALAACPNLTAITIPAKVTRLADNAFNSCPSLKSVTIPETVTEMGKRVFAECDALTTATIYCPSLGDEAFAGCNALKTVNFGTKVTKIGNGAFAACTAVTTITFPTGAALKTIGDKAFNASGLKTVNLKSLNYLTSIGDFAFANANLTSVNFADALQTLGNGALFYNPNLTTMSLPQKATEIGDYLLAGSNKVTGDSIILAGYTGVGDFAFYGWDQTTRFIIPKTVKSIGSQAMAGMTALEEIVCHATEVPTLGEDVWLGIDQRLVDLYVPCKVHYNYNTAPQWQDFFVAGSNLELGDVNGDGVIDVADVVTLANYIIDASSVVEFEVCVADLNRDKGYDVADVVSLANKVMGGN